jgi:hypothetical protein
MISDYEKEFLKSKTIFRKNLIRYNNDLVERIDKMCIEFGVGFSEMVYIIINGDIGLCYNCKINRPKFISNKSGYKKYCSSKCSNSDIDTIENKKKTCLERYGVENPSHINEVKDKISYASKNQSEYSKIKRKETMLDKYGVSSNIFRGDVIVKRNEKLKDIDVITKRKETNIEKYGVSNPMMSDIVKNSFKKTCFKNWENSHFRRSDKFKNKQLYTHIDKLNNSHINDNLVINSLINSNYNIHCSKCNETFDISTNSYNIRKNNLFEICIICNPIKYNRSLSEKSIYEFIKSNYNDEIIQGFRLNGPEIDIYLPDLKLGFEFNGVYWHSEHFKERDYHLNKQIHFFNNDVDLIQIWEDDWLYKKDIIKSIILNKIGSIKKGIFARKCIIKEVSNKESIVFLNKNHIQGWCVSKYRYGLYHNDILVSLMTFGKKRLNLGSKIHNDEYELLRFCNLLDNRIVGGASKLLKKFLESVNVNSLTTFSKNDYSSGNLYEKIGFEYESKTNPNYYWVVNGLRENRFNFRKDKLVSQGEDKKLTEIEIMHSKGYYRVFDSGNKKWTLSIKNKKTD